VVSRKSSAVRAATCLLRTIIMATY